MRSASTGAPTAGTGVATPFALGAFGAGGTMGKSRNRSGGKGSRTRNDGRDWERKVARYLREETELPVHPVNQGGIRDTGDLHGIPDIVVQCKDQGRYALGPWLDDARDQAAAADVSVGVVAIRRREHTAADSYVLMTLESFAQLIKDREALVDIILNAIGADGSAPIRDDYEHYLADRAGAGAATGAGATG